VFFSGVCCSCHRGSDDIDAFCFSLGAGVVLDFFYEPMGLEWGRDSGFTVQKNGDGSFSVRGQKVVRWVRQTNFKNAEAIGYLADRLAQLGVEKELFKKGAVAGSEVRIGSGDNEVVFEWEPTIEAGAEQLAGFLHRRGEDSRLEGAWQAVEREADKLSDEEIARQWEYNVAEPTNPEIKLTLDELEESEEESNKK
jgi:GTP-binding protein